MAHHQHNTNRGHSGLQSILRLFSLSNTPTLPAEGEDYITGEADEPPDDQISPLNTTFIPQDSLYKKSSRPNHDRRESLLTRAIKGDAHSEEYSPTSITSVPEIRGMSTTSTYSNASVTSNGDFTSDTAITSAAGSTTPSPKPSVITLAVKDAKSAEPATTGDPNEAVVEKTLGRKRCITFGCGKAPETSKEVMVEAKKAEPPAVEPPKRKCMLTFACPSRASKSKDLATEVLEQKGLRSHAEPSHVLATRKSSSESVTSTQQEEMSSTLRPKADTSATAEATKSVSVQQQPPTTSFHEFGSSNDEPDAWVDKPTENQPKLTMKDCMKKEYAIRQIGKEAEEEAEQEDEEEDELDDEIENDDNEDDFAPSEGTSDAGNESDDEEGFADSDDESDAGSDYHFWAPSKATSTTTAATSDDNLALKHFKKLTSKQPSLASSLEDGLSGSLPRQYPPDLAFKHPPRRRAPNHIRMRPSTPELPDSTDFVCGTFDEDRPLEAAYLSCREMKKREKHVLVPQDIDPSFPTTDPEDDDNDDDLAGVEEEDEHLWFRDQMQGSDDGAGRGRRKSSTVKKSPLPSPRRFHSPPPKNHILNPIQRPVPTRHNTNRSPPPKHHRRPSPAPRKLFGQSPTRLRSPPPQNRLRSPRGSPTNRNIPLGITITRLAQRPNTGRTASLPHTPNPFFRNYKATSRQPSNLTSGAVTPGAMTEVPDQERHVRGAVDIVIGLEKKRQKRKEKFWRQHCRKAAKEQAERRPAPGRGVERMKELCLECAERTKGYGLGQPAQLVISL